MDSLANGEDGAKQADVGFSANEEQERFLGAPSPLRGTANPERIPLTNEQIANAREQFRHIFDKRYSTLGHGTRAEFAEEILTNGLGAKVPDLSSTAVPLFTPTKEYDEQDPEVFRNLMDWPHYHSDSVVVVQIPNPDSDEKNYPGYTKWFNSVFEDIGENKSEYENRYKIPKEYVRGYWNAALGKFIPNPDFAPKKPVMQEPKQANLADNLRGPVKSTQGSESHSMVIPSSEDDNEVW